MTVAGLFKPFQYLSAWMMVDIARSHGDDGETRPHGREQIGVGAAGAAMVCTFNTSAAGRSVEMSFSVPFSASASSRAEVFP